MRWRRTATWGSSAQPLHDVAGGLFNAEGKRFDWTHDGVEFYRIFRARLFDNRRDVVRSYDGTIQPAPDSVTRGDPRRLTIESASRFNSQIPLEYAYGAWGRLPDGKDGRERALLVPFRQVTKEQLGLFAAHRCAPWRTSNRRSNSRASMPARSRSIYQSSLRRRRQPHSRRACASSSTWSTTPGCRPSSRPMPLPIERRMQTGMALLLRFTGKEPSRGMHRFDVAFDVVGLDPATVMNGLRLKEGAWVVVNTHAACRPRQQDQERKLAVIEAVGDTLDRAVTKPLVYQFQVQVLPRYQAGARCG